MRENINLAPACKIKRGARRQEVETGLGERGPALTLKKYVKLSFEIMKMQHIGSRIGTLGFGQFSSPPIGRLLLLRKINTQQFAREIFEPVPVCIGAHQTRSDFGAIDRRCFDAEAVHHDRNIKAAKMEELQHFWIREQLLKIWRRRIASGDLYEVGAAITPRQLDKT